MDVCSRNGERVDWPGFHNRALPIRRGPASPTFNVARHSLAMAHIAPFVAPPNDGNKKEKGLNLRANQKTGSGQMTQDDTRNVYLQGHFTVPEDRLDQVRLSLPTHIALTRAEEGCISFEVTEDVKCLGQFNVSEVFAN